jgi:hypothetical protein
MQEQIAECQSGKNALWFPSDAELRRLGPQLFCTTCERYKFKKHRCKIFKTTPTGDRPE